MRHRLGGLVLGLIVVGCAAPVPEQALRELVAEAETAAEARNTGFFRDHVSMRYADRSGRDRDALIAALRAYFLMHARIEVATRIDTVALHGEDAAVVTLGMGLVTHTGAALLDGWDGELRRIELEFARERGDWRLIGASW